jgi:tetratricopeptide (TPR) repeat protein
METPGLPVTRLARAICLIAAALLLSGQSFTPPPRTIADITAILDQQKPNPTQTAALQAAADAPITPGLNGRDLADLYVTRADAAAQLGRTKQRLDDLRAALKLARAGNGDLLRILQYLSVAEGKAGNTRTALALREETVKSTPRDFGGFILTQSAQVVSYYAELGNLDEASQWLAKSEALLAQAPRWGAFGTNGEVWRKAVTEAKALVADAAGRFSEAEAAHREVVRLMELTLAKWPQLVDMGPRYQWEYNLDLAHYGLARNLVGQGRLAEAEIEVRQGLLGALKRLGRDAPETANGALQLASILVEQGRYGEAEKLARAAVSIYEETGNGSGSWNLADGRLSVGQAQSLQGKWSDAMATYNRMRSDLAGDTDGQRRYYDEHAAVSVALVMTGHAQEAIPAFEKALQYGTRLFGERSYHTAETRGFYGMALAAGGQRDRALAEFRLAVPILLQSSRQIDEADFGALSSTPGPGRSWSPIGPSRTFQRAR